MMPVMTKIYSSIRPDVKTLAPTKLSSEVSRLTFWHPENATFGDHFFDVSAPTLTAQGVLPRRGKSLPRKHK
jgi:hypothetical protein